MPIAQEAIYKNMKDGVIVLDNQLRVTEINPAVEKIFNRKRSDLIGQPLNLVLPEQARSIEMNQGMTDVQFESVLGESQSQRHYGVNVSPIVIKENLKGYLVILHDDTNE